MKKLKPDTKAKPMETQFHFLCRPLDASLQSFLSHKCQGVWVWQVSKGFVCILVLSSVLIYGQIRSVSVPENECRIPCDLSGTKKTESWL